MANKIKLFQTVADLHSKGKVELTASEKALIEQETADLIRKSQQYRTAAKAPAGFSELLLDLAKMDADEAYTRVIEFMEESGVEVETEAEEAAEEKMEKPSEDEGKEPPEKKEGPSIEKDEDEKPSSPKLPMPPMPSELEGKGVDKEDKNKDDKKEDKDEKKGEGESKTEDKEEKRKELIAQAQELDNLKKEPGMGLGKGPGMGKPMPGKGMERKKRLLELEDEDKKGQDMVDMGMSTPPGINTPSIQASRAKKIKVRITSSGNIVASHEDIGPLFHAVPRDEVKRDLNALKRLANRVYGLIVHDGAEIAARKCGARLLAGADEGIKTDTGDVPPETEGITEGADFAMTESPDSSSVSDPVTDDAEFDTQEKPDKVQARRPVARYKKLSGISGTYQELKRENDWDSEDYGLGEDWFVGEGDPLLIDVVKVGKDDLYIFKREDNDSLFGVLDTDYTSLFWDSDQINDWMTSSNRSASRAAVGAKRRTQGVEDNGSVVTEEKLDPKPDSVTEGDDDVTKDSLPSIPTDSLKDADFDIKSVEANYKKLYQGRAQKMAEAANRKFVEKFAKAIEIAAMRMCCNVDKDGHPLKAAALDTLTGDNVEFSNGDIYTPMDVATATELIELFSSEGHTAFVKQLLDKTADLMEKSPEYLEDVYQDLQSLQPIPVQVEHEKTGRRVASTKIARERNAAYEGNVGMPVVSGGSALPKGKFNVREAIGETTVNRRLGRMIR